MLLTKKLFPSPVCNTANNVKKSNNAGTSQCLNLPIPDAKGNLLVLQLDIANRKQLSKNLKLVKYDLFVNIFQDKQLS